MLVLTGTYPDASPEIIEGHARIMENRLVVGDKHIVISCGAVGMMAAAVAVCSAHGIEPAYCVLAGDTGSGSGSKNLYSYLKDDIFMLEPDVITLHYMTPLVDGMVDFAFALEDRGASPVLVADAGGMYAAKIAGLSHLFDVFTPDRGELAFLADETAAHPMFVNENLYGFPESRVPELAKKLSNSMTSPETLLVKGSTDYIIREGVVIKSVSVPGIPEMEAVGGTGDTLTGIVSALIHSGMPIVDACYLASKINRLAGEYCNTQPDTRISGLIGKIPRALETMMSIG